MGNLPVIAAGELTTGEKLARALDYGAVTAMIGTRFVAAIEASAHSDYKREIIRADASDILLIPHILGAILE